MFRNRNKVDNLIYKACESTCHECSTKYEVENGKTDSVVPKNMENKEIMRGKRKLENREFTVLKRVLKMPLKSILISG